MAQGEEPAEKTSKPSPQPEPATAVKADVLVPAREASTRPLEASSGVPEHGEREPQAGNPPQAAAPAAEPTVRIIEAPEATPVSEMTPALTPSEVKPVLPDEKGGIIFDETSKIDWGEAKGGPADAKEGEAGKVEATPPPPAEAHDVSWGGLQASAPLEDRHGLPVYPPLPRQFFGTGKDIRMFIQNGTFMFFAGAIVYFLTAVYCLGVAFLNAFDPWAFQTAADFGVAGFLAFGLSVGAFACMLLSRSKLEEPLRRNDVDAVRRRLLLAVGAGLVFGLVLGGLLMYLARVKVGELPFPRPAAREDEAAAEDG
jgi:hypothetical protein